jgi:hypothetical protein
MGGNELRRTTRFPKQSELFVGQTGRSGAQRLFGTESFLDPFD